MSWAGRRQFNIFFGLLVLVLGVAFLIIYPRINKPPSCMDGKQNASERGIDCGGGCERFCEFETIPLIVKWQRVLPVTDSIWNAVAYIENQNRTAGIKKINYEFRFYDKDRTFILAKEGTTFIEPNKGSAIFEGQLQMGEATPVYTTFTFTSPQIWYQTDPRFFDMVYALSAQDLSTPETKPRFQATIKNTSPKQTILNLDHIVILYDQDDVAVGFSKTITTTLAPKEEDTLFFTWQNPFARIPFRNEVIVRVDPFNQKYK